MGFQDVQLSPRLVVSATAERCVRPSRESLERHIEIYTVHFEYTSIPYNIKNQPVLQLIRCISSPSSVWSESG
jgi:hypothetical protein